MKILFPAKLDPIHIGHMMQIARLTKNNDVTVALRWDKGTERTMDMWEVKNILYTIFGEKIKIYVYSGSYTKGFPLRIIKRYDAVASANEEILFTAIRQEFPVIQLTRFKGYKSTEMKEMYEREM